MHMDHEEFARRMKTALQARSDGRLDEAVAELRVLLQDLAPAMKGSVCEWHQQQALGLFVDALDAAGRRQECRDAWEALIELTRDASTYWEKALSSARHDYARWSERT
jgi:hypothetical protein